MKVIGFNGSSRKKGNTACSLSTVFAELEKAGIETEMIMPSANYWNVAHGLNPGEMEQDAEGKQIMAVLGRNMAWIMRVIEHGKQDVPAPEPVAKTLTNFIR